MSNTSADEATFIRRFEQVAVFGHLYLASEAGINKSDSRWFDRVAADHNLLPRDVMLIDDDSHNVATAKAAGWDLSAIYKDAISLRTYLRQLGFVLDES